MAWYTPRYPYASGDGYDTDDWHSVVDPFRNIQRFKQLFNNMPFTRPINLDIGDTKYRAITMPTIMGLGRVEPYITTNPATAQTIRNRRFDVTSEPNPAQVPSITDQQLLFKDKKYDSKTFTTPYWRSRDYGRTQQHEDRLSAMERNREYYQRRTGQIHTAPKPVKPAQPPTHTRTLKGLGIAMSYENPDGSRRYFRRGKNGKLQEVALSEEQQRMYADAERNQENQQHNQQLEQYSGANQTQGWGQLQGANDEVYKVTDAEGNIKYYNDPGDIQYDEGESGEEPNVTVEHGTRKDLGADYDYRNEEERRWQLEQRQKAMQRPRPGKPLHLRKNKYRQPWR